MICLRRAGIAPQSRGGPAECAKDLEARRRRKERSSDNWKSDVRKSEKPTRKDGLWGTQAKSAMDNHTPLRRNAGLKFEVLHERRRGRDGDLDPSRPRRKRRTAFRNNAVEQAPCALPAGLPLAPTYRRVLPKCESANPSFSNIPCLFLAAAFGREKRKPAIRELQREGCPQRESNPSKPPRQLPESWGPPVRRHPQVRGCAA